MRRNGKELYRSAEAAYKQNRLPEWNTAFNKGLEQAQNGLVSSKKSDSKAILPRNANKSSIAQDAEILFFTHILYENLGL